MVAEYLKCLAKIVKMSHRKGKTGSIFELFRRFGRFPSFFLCTFGENAYLCAINLRVIHNKGYSVVNIKESQNYFLIVAVLFLLISASLT